MVARILGILSLAILAPLIYFCAGIISTAQAQGLPSLAVYKPLQTESVRSIFSNNSLEIEILRLNLESDIRATRQFAIFERSATVLQQTVYAEQNFALDPRALGDAANFGKMNNVRFIVQAIVENFIVSTRSDSMDDVPGRYRNTSNASIDVVFKVLDTTTGEIKHQFVEHYQDTKSNIGNAKQTLITAQQAWATGSVQISRNASSQLSESVFPILVISVEGDDIFINRGENNGFAAGDVMRLFSRGKALVDPVTKENLGAAETINVNVKVIQVSPKFSVVRPMVKPNSPVREGDIIRR